ncbi:MAG TPA: ribosome recycling factor [Dehalococcoidia bacterium]|nr:ribosome recycling factor [Dehalococcoidia bacterium]
MIDDILRDTEAKMHKTIEVLGRELASIRTGRASPALVESIKVDYYGVPTPINQLASISAPEARLLLIQPWDRSALGNIEKAILKSELGLNPSNDGHVIRLPIPPLTEERRQQLVKLVHRRVEEGRISLRNLRREALEHLRRLEKERTISQDERERAQERLQKLTDSFIAEAGKRGEDKEAELIEF